MLLNVGIVFEGIFDLVVEGQKHTDTKGDRYDIPEGTKHSGKVYGGCADISFFAEPTRYSLKKEKI